MKDLYGKALLDYAAGRQDEVLYIDTSYGTTEEMPVEHYFREYDGLPDVEQIALQFCNGKVLDIGAGTGIHALLLQEQDVEVVALENSPAACRLLKDRGVKQIRQADIYTFKEEGSYDTVLVLMNGLGLAGTLSNLPVFLRKCASLLAEGGHILLDSSDIEYLYEEEGVERPEGKYYGELAYRYVYLGQKDEWFPWLYVDQETLTQVAEEAGLETQVLFTDENDQYLARLTKKD